MIIKVKVITRASQTKIEQQPDGSFKAWLKSAPVEGKANDELVELLADYFKVSKSQINVVKGLKSKNKTIELV